MQSTQRKSDCDTTSRSPTPLLPFFHTAAQAATALKMSGLRFLDLIKPFTPLLPEVAAPEAAKIPFNQKLMWTGLTLLIFLVMSQMPLYGIVSSDTSDPIYWLRMMLASNRGTLMELGTTPIISSGMVFQLLAGTHLIDVNLDLKSDRELYQTAQKVGFIHSKRRE